MDSPADSCEDVIEQCPTKIDRLGGNYFLAVELLTLVETGQGAKAGCGLAVCDIYIYINHILHDDVAWQWA